LLKAAVSIAKKCEFSHKMADASRDLSCSGLKLPIIMTSSHEWRLNGQPGQNRRDFSSIDENILIQVAISTENGLG